MSLRLIRAVADAETSDELHLARLMVLLLSADAKKRTPETKARAVEGITKLAKLDFFLRYPTYLERALAKLDKPVALARVEPRERDSIETSMIRFRYGPWDARYRRWLGLLSARELIGLSLHGNTVMIGLTELGREVATRLRSTLSFMPTGDRSDVVVAELGKMPATRLKDFTYEVVPEITGMKWGDAIDVEPR
jgi:hypothetical protein